MSLTIFEVEIKSQRETERHREGERERERKAMERGTAQERVSERKIIIIIIKISNILLQ